MTVFSSTHYRILQGGLLLFGFSLALSKTASTVLMLLTYAYVVFLAAYSRDFRKAAISVGRQPLLIPFLIFLLVTATGLIYSENVSRGLTIVNKVVNLPMIYLMFSALIDFGRDEKEKYTAAEYTLLSFIAGLFILDLIGVMTYAGVIGHERLVLPLRPLHIHHIWFSNLNASGLYAAAAFLFYSPLRSRPAVKAFLLTFIFLGLVSVLLSTARSAWFGIMFTTVILAYLMMREKKKFLLGVSSLAVSCVLLYAFNSIVHDRVNQIAADLSRFFSGDPATSVGARLLMWKAAFKMFLSSPVFGVGTGDYGAMMDGYARAGEFPEFLLKWGQPHNMYLFTLATNGLLGLSAMLYIFYRIFRFSLPLLHTFQRERFFGFLAVAVLIHYMIAGLTDSFFNIQILRYTFAFVMGICVRRSLTVGKEEGG